MGSIAWDIVHTALGVVALIRLSRPALVWLATALRARDQITRQRQIAIATAPGLALIGIACIVMAKRVLVIAPIAVAAAHLRNALATDCALVTVRLTRRLATI